MTPFNSLERRVLKWARARKIPLRSYYVNSYSGSCYVNWLSEVIVLDRAFGISSISRLRPNALTDCYDFCMNVPYSLTERCIYIQFCKFIILTFYYKKSHRFFSLSFFNGNFTRLPQTSSLLKSSKFLYFNHVLYVCSLDIFIKPYSFIYFGFSFTEVVQRNPTF